MANSEGQAGYNEVFVSYSRNDEAFAKKIVKTIYDSGYQNIWIDWEDIEYAEDWWIKIQKGIESADNFIFLLTPHSAKSKVCFDEVDYAVKSGKRIVPIIHTDISQNDIKQLHSAISQHNWLPFRDTDDFETGIKTLLETIKADLDHVRNHTRLLTRARDWEDVDRSQSRILSAGELNDTKSWLAKSDQELKSPRPTKLQREFIESSASFYRNRRRQIIILIVFTFILIGGIILVSIAFQQQSQIELQNIALTQIQQEQEGTTMQLANVQTQVRDDSSTILTQGALQAENTNLMSTIVALEKTATQAAQAESIVEVLSTIITYPPANIQTEVAPAIATFRANFSLITATPQP